MANLLMVNGIRVPVLAGDASVSLEIAGESGRGVNGAMFSQRTAIKRVFEGSTPPLPALTALALEGLIHGRGHAWDFSAALGLYSARGALFTGIGGSVSVATSFGKFGGRSMLVPPGVIAVSNAPLPFAGVGVRGPAVSFWLSLNGSTWDHYVYRFEVSSWYTNGGLSAGPFLVDVAQGTGGAVEFVNSTGANIWLDDVWIAPYDFPASWAAEIHAFNSATGLCPRLRVEGDALDANVVKGGAWLGEVTRMSLTPGVVGTFQQNLHSLEFALSEE